MKAYLVVMKNRREIVQLGPASLALAAMDSSETRGGAGMRTIYKRDLPPLSLDGWQVTVVQLIFPTGFTSPKHVHPGFVLGYVLEGELRFHIEGEPQTRLSAGDAFYEAQGRHPSAFWQREHHQASQGSGCGFRRKRKGTNETPHDK
jgi:quercetin dioxygenase-like cupin family protein